MVRKLAIVVGILLLVASFSSVAAQDGTIVDVAAGNEDFSTLAGLIQSAGLTDALSAEGPFTVFAPTNEAFAALPQPVMDYLGTNTDLLSQVLNYHVVEGSMMSGDIAAGEVATLDMGNTVNVAVDDMGVHVNNATVVTADVAASNGVIHAIDSVLIPAITLPEVDPLAVTENIVIAGSSTVYPVTQRIADLFNQDGFGGTITVDSIGSGAGFERFCVNAETDISNASRPIKAEEVEACQGNGRAPLGFYIGIDALAITVSSENDFVDSLTLEQLAQIFGGGTNITWADVNPAWPAEPIQLYSPGSDSGTYDYFVEAIFEQDETPIQNAGGVQFSEDDNVLVVGVESSPYAIGYFGFAYYQENKDRLKVVSIEGVTPSEETGASGEYPLSRPLFIYSAPSIMQEKAQVATFINYYLQNVNAQLGTGADQIGYIPTNEYIQRQSKLYWLAGTGAMSSGM
ncbi:MAG: phosphate ABC transporter substrate-binding protein PstS family protein [Anaerolineae bacterium]|nr:phosphate ABC transporter substrate-binding protein PstS family protein [Anaerolineae bacterium]